MAGLKIDVPLRRAPAAVLASVRSGLELAGGSLTGDETAGAFQMPSPLGPIRGTYAVTAARDAVSVDITERPAVLGETALRFFVVQYITWEDPS